MQPPNGRLHCYDVRMSTASRAFLVIPISLALLFFAGVAYAQDANTSANKFCKPDAEWDYLVKCGEPVYDAVGNLTGKKGGKDCRCEDNTSCDNGEIIIGKCVKAGVCHATTDCEGRSVKLSPEGEKVQLKPGTAVPSPVTPQKTVPPSLSGTGDVSGGQPPGTSGSLLNQMLEKPTEQPKSELSPSANAVGDFLEQSKTQPGFMGEVGKKFEGLRNYLFPPQKELNNVVPLAGEQVPGSQISFEGQETPEAPYTAQSTFGQPQTTAPAEPRWWETAGNWTKEAAGNVGSWISDTYSSLTGTSDTAPPQTQSPATDNLTALENLPKAADTLTMQPVRDEPASLRLQEENLAIREQAFSDANAKVLEAKAAADAKAASLGATQVYVLAEQTEPITNFPSKTALDAYNASPEKAALDRAVKEGQSVLNEYTQAAKAVQNAPAAERAYQALSDARAEANVDAAMARNTGNNTAATQAEARTAGLTAAQDYFVSGKSSELIAQALTTEPAERTSAQNAALGAFNKWTAARADFNQASEALAQGERRIAELQASPQTRTTAARIATLESTNDVIRNELAISQTRMRQADDLVSQYAPGATRTDAAIRLENGLAGTAGAAHTVSQTISDTLHSGAKYAWEHSNYVSAVVVGTAAGLYDAGANITAKIGGVLGWDAMQNVATNAQQLNALTQPASWNVAQTGVDVMNIAVMPNKLSNAAFRSVAEGIGAVRGLETSVLAENALRVERAAATEFRPTLAANENIAPASRFPSINGEAVGGQSLRTSELALNENIAPGGSRFTSEITREGPALAANDNLPGSALAQYRKDLSVLEARADVARENGAFGTAENISRQIQALDDKYGQAVVSAARTAERAEQPLYGVGAQAAEKLPVFEAPQYKPLARLPANESWVPTDINMRSFFGPAEVTGISAPAAGVSSGLSLGAFGYVPPVLGTSFSNAFASAPPALALPATPPLVTASPGNLSPVLTQASPAPAPVVQTTIPTAPELTAAEKRTIGLYGTTDGAAGNPRVIKITSPSGPITILDYIRNNFGDAAAQRARESLYQYGDPWAGLLSGGGAGGSASARASSEPPVRTPAPVPITSLPPSGITLAPPTTVNPQPANQNPSQKPALSVVPTYPAWWNEIAGTPIARTDAPVVAPKPVESPPDAIVVPIAKEQDVTTPFIQAAPKTALPENVTVAPRSLWQSIATVPSLVRTAVITAALSNPVVGEFVNFITPAIAKPNEIALLTPVKGAGAPTTIPAATQPVTSPIPGTRLAPGEPQNLVASFYDAPAKDKLNPTIVTAAGATLDVRNYGLLSVALNQLGGKTVPLGAIVEITDKVNGKSVLAVVNNRMSNLYNNKRIDLPPPTQMALGAKSLDPVSVRVVALPDNYKYLKDRTDYVLGLSSDQGKQLQVALNGGTNPPTTVVAKTEQPPAPTPAAKVVPAPPAPVKVAATVRPPVTVTTLEEPFTLAAYKIPPPAPSKTVVELRDRVSDITSQIEATNQELASVAQQRVPVTQQIAKIQNVAKGEKNLVTAKTGLAQLKTLQSPDAKGLSVMSEGTAAANQLAGVVRQLGNPALANEINRYVTAANLLKDPKNQTLAKANAAILQGDSLVGKAESFLNSVDTGSKNLAALQKSLQELDTQQTSIKTSVATLQTTQKQVQGELVLAIKADAEAAAAARIAEATDALRVGEKIPESVLMTAEESDLAMQRVAQAEAAGPSEARPSLVTEYLNLGERLVEVAQNRISIAFASAPAEPTVRVVSVTAASEKPYMPRVVQYSPTVNAPSAPLPTLQARLSNAVKKEEIPQVQRGSGGALPETNSLPEPTVYILAGGTGAGKTTVASGVLPKLNPSAAIIDDASLDAAGITRSVNDALAAGKVPNVVYVHRDPIEAFAANRNVPIDSFAESYVESQQAVKGLLENQALQKEGLQITLLDNSRGLGNAVPMTREAFSAVPRPSLAELKQQLLAKTDGMYEAGTINAQEYKAITGTEAPAKVALAPAEPVAPVIEELPPVVPSVPTGPIETGWVGPEVEGQIGWLRGLYDGVSDRFANLGATIRDAVPSIPDPTYQPITPIPTSKSLVPNTAPVGPSSPVASPLAQPTPTQYVNAQGAASPEVGKVMPFYPGNLLPAPPIRPSKMWEPSPNLNRASPPAVIAPPVSAPNPTVQQNAVGGILQTLGATGPLARISLIATMLSNTPAIAPFQQAVSYIDNAISQLQRPILNPDIAAVPATTPTSPVVGNIPYLSANASQAEVDAYVAKYRQPVNWKQIWPKDTRVLLIGETHNIPAVRYEVVEALKEGGATDLVTEFFKWSEQTLIDGYIKGTVSRTQMADHLRKYDYWSEGTAVSVMYMLDSAKNAGIHVLAAERGNELPFQVRNEGWALVVQQILKRDPNARIVVHGGAAHFTTGYNADTVGKILEKSDITSVAAELTGGRLDMANKTEYEKTLIDGRVVTAATNQGLDQASFSVNLIPGGDARFPGNVIIHLPQEIPVVELNSWRGALDNELATDAYLQTFPQSVSSTQAAIDWFTELENAGIIPRSELSRKPEQNSVASNEPPPDSGEPTLSERIQAIFGSANTAPAVAVENAPAASTVSIPTPATQPSNVVPFPVDRTRPPATVVTPNTPAPPAVVAPTPATPEIQPTAAEPAIPPVVELLPEPVVPTVPPVVTPAPATTPLPSLWYDIRHPIQMLNRIFSEGRVALPVVIAERPTLVDIPEELGGFNMSGLQKNVPKAAEPAPLPAKAIEPPTLADIPNALGGHDISGLQTVANGIPLAPVPVAVAPSVWTRISNWFTGRATPAVTPTPTVTGGGGGAGGNRGGPPDDPTAEPQPNTGDSAAKPGWWSRNWGKVTIGGGTLLFGPPVVRYFLAGDSTPAGGPSPDKKALTALEKKTGGGPEETPPPDTTTRRTDGPKACGPNDTYASSGCYPPYGTRTTSEIPSSGDYCISSIEPLVVVPGVKPGPNCYNYSGSKNPLSSLGSTLGQLLGRLFGTTQPAPTQQTQPTKPPVTPPTATTTPAKPYATLVASPTSVTEGGKSRLIWTSVNTSGCELFAPDNFLMATGTRGSTSTLPLATTTAFSLDCRAPSGATTTASTTVSVR